MVPLLVMKEKKLEIIIFGLERMNILLMIVDDMLLINLLKMVFHFMMLL